MARTKICSDPRGMLIPIPETVVKSIGIPELFEHSGSILTNTAGDTQVTKLVFVC
jgi:hypothetical protein